MNKNPKEPDHSNINDLNNCLQHNIEDSKIKVERKDQYQHKENNGRYKTNFNFTQS